MTFWVRFLEIWGNFHHKLDVYRTSFHHVFTTFHYIYTTFTLRIFTIWNFHDIFSLHFHHKFTPQRDKQTGMNRLYGDTQRDFHHIFTPQIYTTHFHHNFFYHNIYTTDFHHKIYTTNFHHDIYITNLHHKFTPQL